MHISFGRNYKKKLICLLYGLSGIQVVISVSSALVRRRRRRRCGGVALKDPEESSPDLWRMLFLLFSCESGRESASSSSTVKRVITSPFRNGGSCNSLSPLCCRWIGAHLNWKRTWPLPLCFPPPNVCLNHNCLLWGDMRCRDTSHWADGCSQSDGMERTSMAHRCL